MERILSLSPVLSGDSLRLSFLVRAGDLLAAPAADDSALVATLARFAVPEFADHCLVYLIEDDGVARLRAAVATDPETEQLLRSSVSVPPEGSLAAGAAAGKAEIWPHIDADSVAHLSAPAREIVRALHIHSGVAVPVVAQGRLLGALSFHQSISRRIFTAEDAALAEELGKRTGIALDSARLLRREQAARRLLEIMSAASDIAAEAGLDTTALAKRLVDMLAWRVGDACALRMLGSDGVSLELLAVAHHDPEASALLHDLLSQNKQRRDEGGAAIVFDTGRPLQTSARSDEEMVAAARPWFAPYVRRFGGRCVLYLPMRAGGRVAGLLSLGRDRGADYSADDREALQQIADRAAAALETRQLHEAEQATRKHAEIAAAQTRRMYKVATALASALDQRQIARLVVDQGIEALHARAGAVAVIDGEGPALVLLASSGFSAEAQQRWHRIPLAAKGPTAEAVRTDAAIYISSLDEYQQSHPDLGQDLCMAGDQALFAVPLRFEGRVIGALCMTFALPREFPEEERALAEALAFQCAQALERARLFEEAQRSRARFAFVAEAARVLSSSLDYRTTLANVARLVVPGLADWCGVELFEDGVAKLVASSHVDPEKVQLANELRERYPPRPEDPSGVYEVMRTGAPQLFREISDVLLARGARDAEHLRILRALGVRSAIVVPLAARGRVLGAITLVSTQVGRFYGPVELGTAQDLARQAAAAVDNSRLFAEAQEAVSVRDSFLSIAGHELRTPLTALKLQLQTLDRLVSQEMPLDRVKLAPATKLAVRQSNRLERLIHQLLDVSRIVAGRLRLDCEEVDLYALTSEVAGRFSEELARAGCALKLIADADARGNWDQARLDQVITNLLGNAIKYGKGTPVEVAIQRRGGEVVLSVQDHGIGIAPEHQARIFGRFERAVSERHYGGLGLGLWIVREIVLAHGGNITCTSAPGQGSTFTVALPVLPPASKPPPSLLAP